jgi:uncharacterized membrane protein
MRVADCIKIIIRPLAYRLLLAVQQPSGSCCMSTSVRENGFPWAAALFVAAMGAVAGAFMCLALTASPSPAGTRCMVAASAVGAGIALSLWSVGYRREGRAAALVRSVPWSACLILVPFFPDYCVGPGLSPILSLSLLGISMLCFVVLRSLMLRQPVCPPAELVHGIAPCLVLVACVLFVAVSIVHAVAMYERFAYPGNDLGIFTQSFWTTLHGKFFQNTHEPGGSRFGRQFCPIVFFILPLFALFPHPVTILALDAAALGLGALPVYLYARDFLGRYAAACFGLIFLLYPGIVYQAGYPVYFIHYTPLFLMLALYYFEKERLGLFCLFLVLSCFPREDIALTTFMFGVYAALRRRPAQWILLPVMMSTAWFAATHWLIVPCFGPGSIQCFYKDSGGCVTGLLRTIFVTPTWLFSKLVSASLLKLLYLMLMPLGIVLPVMGLESVCVIPNVLEIALSSVENTRSFYAYYYLPSIPFLIAGAITAIARLASGRFPAFMTAEGKVKALSTLILFLSLSVFVRGPCRETVIREIRPWSERTDAGYLDTLRKVVVMIPPDASVFAPRYMMPHLARRMSIAFVHPGDADYLIVDEGTQEDLTVKVQSKPFIRSLDARPEYCKIFEENGVKVYRRR